MYLFCFFDFVLYRVVYTGWFIQGGLYRVVYVFLVLVLYLPVQVMENSMFLVIKGESVTQGEHNRSWSLGFRPMKHFSLLYNHFIVCSYVAKIHFFIMWCQKLKSLKMDKSGGQKFNVTLLGSILLVNQINHINQFFEKNRTGWWKIFGHVLSKKDRERVKMIINKK